MKLTLFTSTICGLVLLVQCRPPFFHRPKPTLPPASNTNYYKKFQVVPPKNETADKLVRNFLRIRVGGIGKRNDIEEDGVAVLDSSGSIKRCEFDKGRHAMRNMMKIVFPGYSYQYAGVVYSTKASRLFNFLPGSQAADQIIRAPFEQGFTNTADGLAKAKELYLDRNAGGRPYARKMVFLVTDGQSNVNRAMTIPNAQDLKDLNIEVFVIAVGTFERHLAALTEMAHVATYPPEKYLFRVENYDGFYQIVQLAIERIGLDFIKIVGNLPPPCST